VGTLRIGGRQKHAVLLKLAMHNWGVLPGDAERFPCRSTATAWSPTTGVTGHSSFEAVRWTGGRIINSRRILGPRPVRLAQGRCWQWREPGCRVVLAAGAWPWLEAPCRPGAAARSQSEPSAPLKAHRTSGWSTLGAEHEPAALAHNRRGDQPQVGGCSGGDDQHPRCGPGPQDHVGDQPGLVRDFVAVLLGEG
jgi:hypothetical protein